MEEYVNQITSYIDHLDEFEILDISSSFSQASNSNLSYNNMGATLIDGILQAGINYKNVVKPRVDNYLSEYSQVKTTTAFNNLLKTKDLSQIINMTGQKVERINQVVNLLLKNNIETEYEFYNWLLNDDSVIILSNITGIKEKTIDYLKILVGFENTVAIDTRLKAFIKIACPDITSLTYGFAHRLLTKTAEKLKLTPATLDYSIWNYMSNKLREKVILNNVDPNYIIEFYSKYSDDQLKKLIAVEMTSKTDKSPSLKNLIDEVKRRDPQMEICDFTDYNGIINYLNG
jgi:hypothetical protein